MCVVKLIFWYHGLRSLISIENCLVAMSKMHSFSYKKLMFLVNYDTMVCLYLINQVDGRIDYGHFMVVANSFGINYSVC